MGCVGGKEIDIFFGYDVSWLGTKSPAKCQKRGRRRIVGGRLSRTRKFSVKVSRELRIHDQ